MEKSPTRASEGVPRELPWEPDNSDLISPNDLQVGVGSVLAASARGGAGEKGIHPLSFMVFS